MKPFRALAGLGLMIGGWLWWRVPQLGAELAALSARAHIPATAQSRPSAISGVAITRTALAAADALVARSPRRRWTTETRELSDPKPQIGSTPDPPAVSLENHAVAISAVVPNHAQPLALPTEEPAALGYRLLAAGDRRAANLAFRQALRDAPGDARHVTWAGEVERLERRWSGSAYIFARGSEAATFAVSPVLGGGQSGAQILYTPDPLARRPVAIEARVSARNRDTTDGLQTAIGATWKLHPTVSLTIERLTGGGAGARNGWTARAGGGAATVRPNAARHWLDASIYAEAGAIGVSRHAYFGAVQGRVGRALSLSDSVIVVGGFGGWASIQRDRATVSRVEIGPTLRARAGPLELSADYRLRIAGNAAPGSGPALTIAAFF